MNLELLSKIFNLFFPGKPYEVRVDKFETLLTTIENNIKYIVEYNQEDDHIQVFKVDLNERFMITCIVEGSPQDIIKLAKLLSND